MTDSPRHPAGHPVGEAAGVPVADPARVVADPAAAPRAGVGAGRAPAVGAEQCDGHALGHHRLVRGARHHPRGAVFAPGRPPLVAVDLCGRDRARPARLLLRPSRPRQRHRRRLTSEPPPASIPGKAGVAWQHGTCRCRFPQTTPALRARRGASAYGAPAHLLRGGARQAARRSKAALMAPSTRSGCARSSQVSRTTS